MARSLSSDRESSVLFSLRELQSIEVRRVEEEAGAEREVVAARDRVRLAEEARLKEAAAARVRAEAEAARHARDVIVLRVREEALRVKESEARARADHEAAVEERRLADEMAVRRLAASKQRPTWLVAGVAVAVVATAIAVFIAVDRSAATARADALARTAEQDRVAALDKVKVANDGLAAAKRALGEVNDQLTVLQGQIAQIDRDIANANTAAKRGAAEQAAAELRRRERQLRAEAEARARGIKLRCPPEKPMC